MENSVVCNLKMQKASQGKVKTRDKMGIKSYLLGVVRNIHNFNVAPSFAHTVILV